MRYDKYKKKLIGLSDEAIKYHIKELEEIVKIYEIAVYKRVERADEYYLEAKNKLFIATKEYEDREFNKTLIINELEM